MPARSRNLVLRPGLVVYSGPGVEAARHRHFAVQVVRSGEPFEITIGDERRTTDRATVPSMVEHSLRAPGWIEVSLIEPEGTWKGPPTGLGRKAIEYVEANLDGRPSLGQTAAALNISDSRLTHVFTEEVGIPFRRYVLWARLRRVVEEIREGSNLTRAALDAGFSDSSHLSRVFRENFGITPSWLLGMEISPDWSS